MAVDTTLILPLVVLFLALAVVTATVVSIVLARYSPERQRLKQLEFMGVGAGAIGGVGAVGLTAGEKSAFTKTMASFVPKSPKEMNKLERRLARAGYTQPHAATVYSLSEMLLPVVLVFPAYLLGGGGVRGLFLALFAAAVGYALPGFWLANRTAARKKRIHNGLPDALDLMVVCVEAGSALEQAIVKTTDELAMAHPDLTAELRMVHTELKAGKPRAEAFRNFATRTGEDDVRALVAMLIQTDRFGTSVAQALRTHAQVSRTKRRQQAEERAAKLGVKLVFPLVFLLFPALYIVVLGPAIIKIMEFLIE
jgi:tight adherence protein C